MDLKKVFADPALLFMTGFGSGLSPIAPGTVGSIIGLVIFLPVLLAPVLVQLSFIIAGLALGIHYSDRVSKELNVKDPGMIVWDEFIGMWISMLFLPGLIWLPLAFVLFRFFDIVKPWPISWADRELKGGFGIMIDDVIAGLMVLLLVQAISLTL